MAENVICFFSGTGNSFDVAKRLADQMDDTELYNIATHDPGLDVSKFSRVGLVFPIYAFSMPDIVKRFISGMSYDEEKFYFCVATFGVFGLGALHRIAEAFATVGGSFNYMMKVHMPENYILLSRVPSDGMIVRHLNNSNKRIEEIARDILSHRTRAVKTPPPPNPLKRLLLSQSSKYKNTSRGFRVSASCDKCGRCVRLCPVGNIELTDDGIVFSDRCESCLSCLHACPNEAINFLNKTAGKKRYLNPNVNIEEMKNY